MASEAPQQTGALVQSLNNIEFRNTPAAAAGIFIIDIDDHHRAVIFFRQLTGHRSGDTQRKLRVTEHYQRSQPLSRDLSVGFIHDFGG